MNSNLEKFTPYALALLRIVAAYMFLLHGTAKFFEFPVSMTGGNGAVPLMSMYGISGILEIGGGILLLLGLFTRPVAFLLSGMMAYAYFFTHATAENIALPLVNQGELALLYSVVFFLLVFVGAGTFALDNKRQNLNK
ncbi:DoxX family protein [Actinobacillus ureae ATCC 25976]|uniref:DoxX family protein n=1 Tax=Actinobacillus ureae ATCC 25976 TaxID=887324 RepID=E8KF44_9PAST|nr:DoxX family protein [Actinobacillus ureae]EFX92471.1 DoxX family protein [Actinobacillus ureae ATCC 25976]